MASIYRRERSPYWWIKYRDHEGNVARVSAGTESEDAAREFAEKVEHICSIARENPGPIRKGALEQLAQLGLVDADAILPPAPRPEDDPLDLIRLAEAHPMVQTERRERPGHFKSHDKRLREFIAKTGTTSLAELTAESARAFVLSLVKARMTSEQIRHRLYYLRAAGAMAAERGHPNPLMNLKVPRSVAPPRVERTMTIEELASVLASGIPQRLRIIIALQSAVGLRLSEVTRLWWDDIRGDLIHVGSRVAKTADSNRILPLPPTLKGWIDELRTHREENGWTSPLMLTHVRHTKSQCLDMRRTGFAIARAIRASTGDEDLMPKVLRKSFATIAVWEVGMPPEVVESFLGRRISTLGTATARHYLGKAHADRLRPWSLKMDEALKAHKLGTPTSDD